MKGTAWVRSTENVPTKEENACNVKQFPNMQGGTTGHTIFPSLSFFIVLLSSFFSVAIGTCDETGSWAHARSYIHCWMNGDQGANEGKRERRYSIKKRVRGRERMSSCRRDSCACDGVLAWPYRLMPARRLRRVGA